MMNEDCWECDGAGVDCYGETCFVCGGEGVIDEDSEYYDD